MLSSAQLPPLAAAHIARHFSYWPPDKWRTPDFNSWDHSRVLTAAAQLAQSGLEPDALDSPAGYEAFLLVAEAFDLVQIVQNSSKLPAAWQHFVYMVQVAATHVRQLAHGSLPQDNFPVEYTAALRA